MKVGILETNIVCNHFYLTIVNSDDSSCVESNIILNRDKCRILIKELENFIKGE